MKLRSECETARWQGSVVQHGNVVVSGHCAIGSQVPTTTTTVRGAATKQGYREVNTDILHHAPSSRHDNSFMAAG